MSPASSIALGDIMATKSSSVDPSKFTEEIFELYSIPAFDRGEPEIVAGSEIGSAKQVVEPGDVLLSKIVPHIRRSWIVGKDRGRRIIASGEWIVFRSERAHPDYLRQVLVGDPFHTQFMNTVAGVGGSLLRARPAHVAKIAIPLPPMAEQRRIADVLDGAEALRAKRRAALAQLDSLTQSLFLDLFGDLPEQDAARLDALAELKRGPFGGALKKEIFVEAGYKVYEQRNAIYDDFAIGRYFINEGKFLEMEDFAISPRDLIVSCSGTLGKVAIAPDDVEPGIINQALLRVRPDATRVTPLYLKHALETLEMQAKLSGLSHGTGLQNFPPMSDVRALRVRLPPLPLQREFARRVTAVEKLKTAQRASLAELDALFASLQHRAFRDEL